MKQVLEVQIQNITKITPVKAMPAMMAVEFDDESQIDGFIGLLDSPDGIRVTRNKHTLLIADHSENQSYLKMLKDVTPLLALQTTLKDAQEQQTELQGCVGAIELTNVAKSYEVKADRKYGLADREEITKSLDRFLAAYKAYDKEGEKLANLLPNQNLSQLVSQALGAITTYSRYPSSERTRDNKNVMAEAIANAEAEIIRLSEESSVSQVVQKSNDRLQNFSKSLAAVTKQSKNLPEEVQSMNDTDGVILELQDAFVVSQGYIQPITQQLNDRHELPKLDDKVKNALKQKDVLQEHLGAMELVTVAKSYEVKEGRDYKRKDRKEISKNVKGFLETYKQLEAGGINLADALPNQNLPQLIDTVNTALDAITVYKKPGKIKTGRRIMAAVIEKAEAEIAGLSDKGLVSDLVSRTDGQFERFNSSLTAVGGVMNGLSEQAQASSGQKEMIEELRQAFNSSKEHFQSLETELGVKQEAIQSVVEGVKECMKKLDDQLMVLTELKESKHKDVKGNYEQAIKACNLFAELDGRLQHKSTKELLEHFKESEEEAIVEARATITSAQEQLEALTLQVQGFQKAFPKPPKPPEPLKPQPEMNAEIAAEIQRILSHKKASILVKKGEEGKIYVSFKDAEDAGLDQAFSKAIKDTGYPFENKEYLAEERTFTLNTYNCSTQLMGALHQAASEKKITPPKTSKGFKERLFSDPHYYLISDRSGSTSEEKTSMQAISSNAHCKLNAAGASLDTCYDDLIQKMDTFVGKLFENEGYKDNAIANGRLLFEDRYANKHALLGYEADKKWDDFDEEERLEVTKRLFQFYIIDSAVGGKCTIDQQDAFTQLMIFVADEDVLKATHQVDLAGIGKSFYETKAPESHEDVKDNILRNWLIGCGKAHENAPVEGTEHYEEQCIDLAIGSQISEEQQAQLAMNLIKSNGINKVDKPFAEKMYGIYCEDEQGKEIEETFAGFVKESYEIATKQITELLYGKGKTIPFEEINYDGALIDKFALVLAQKSFLRSKTGEETVLTFGEKIGLQEALIRFDAGHHIHKTYGIHPSSQLLKDNVATSTIVRPEDGSRISEYTLNGQRVVACEATYNHKKYYEYVADKAFGHTLEEGTPVLLSLTQEINNRTYDFKRSNKLDSHHLNLLDDKDLPLTLSDGTVVSLKKTEPLYHPDHLDAENTLHDITENTLELTRNGKTSEVKHYIYRGWADGRHLEALNDEQTYQLMTTLFEHVEKGLVISNCAEGIGRANASLVMGNAYKRVHDIVDNKSLSNDVAADKLIQFYYSSITREQLLQPVWDGVRKDAAIGHQAMIKKFVFRMVTEQLEEKGLDQETIKQLIIDPHTTDKEELKKFNDLTAKASRLTVVDLMDEIEHAQSRSTLKLWVLEAAIEIPNEIDSSYWKTLESRYKDKDSTLRTVLDTRKAIIAEGIEPKPLDFSVLFLAGQDELFNQMHEVPVSHYQQIGKILSAAETLRSQDVSVGNLKAEQLSNEPENEQAFFNMHRLAGKVSEVLTLEKGIKETFQKESQYQLKGSSFTSDPFSMEYSEASKQCRETTALLENIKKNVTELGLTRVYQEEGLTTVSKIVAFHKQEQYSTRTEELGEPTYTAAAALTKKATELTKRNVYETSYDDPAAILGQSTESYQETTGRNVPTHHKVAAGVANVSLTIASAPLSAARGFVSGLVEAGNFSKKLSRGQEVGNSVQEMFLSSMTAATGSTNMQAASAAIERQDPIEKGSRSGFLKRLATTTLLTPAAFVAMPILGAIGVLGTSVTSAAKDTMEGKVAKDFSKKHRTWGEHTATGLKRLVKDSKPKENNDVNDVLRSAFKMLDKERDLKVKADLKGILRSYVDHALNTSLPSDIAQRREDPESITPRAVNALTYELTRAMPLIIAKSKQKSVSNDNIQNVLSNDLKKVMSAASVLGATAYEYNASRDSLTTSSDINLEDFSVLTHVHGGTRVQREEMRYTLQNIVRDEYHALFTQKAEIKVLESGQVVFRQGESDAFLADREATETLKSSLRDVADGIQKHLNRTGVQPDIHTWMKDQVRENIKEAYGVFTQGKEGKEQFKVNQPDIQQIRSEKRKEGATQTAIRDVIYTAVKLNTSKQVAQDYGQYYTFSFNNKGTADYVFERMEALEVTVTKLDKEGSTTLTVTSDKNTNKFMQKAFELKASPKHEKALTQAVYQTSESYFIDIITEKLGKESDTAKDNKASIQKSASTLAKTIDVTTLSTENRDDLKSAIENSLDGLSHDNKFKAATGIQTNTKEAGQSWANKHIGQSHKPAWSSRIISSTVNEGKFRQ